MIEKRPVLTALSHLVLILGVAIVAFPIYLTLIASTHRALAVSEKMVPGDGIAASEEVMAAAEVAAGDALPAFTNPHSIGIELHAAITEPITGAQKQALAELLRDLAARWRIAAPLIDSHRAVALPKGRKSDPATWPQAELRAWVDGVLTCRPADAPPA